jgi:AraC-like DNA-binding protein
MTDPRYPNREVRLERYNRSRVPSSLFLTYRLAPDDRFIAWRESMGVFLESRLSTYRDIGRFSGEIESYLLDDIMLTRGMSVGQKYDRTVARIAHDGLDHYMIQIFLQGNCEMKVHGREVKSAPGRAIAFDLAEVMDSINSGFDVLCIVVPRARLAPLLTNPDSMHGQMPDAESGAGIMLADFVASLYLAAPSLTPTEAKSAMRALLEMLAAAFNGAPAGEVAARDAGRQALLLRAQIFIRENLAAADLGPETIALSVGVSRTALYRLFEPIGGIANYVREIRLRKCLAEIMSVRHAHRQVSEIAYRWGFTDASHFARLFKQRFGRTPSEAREAADPTARRERRDLDPLVGDRRYEEWIAGLA